MLASVLPGWAQLRPQMFFRSLLHKSSTPAWRPTQFNAKPCLPALLRLARMLHHPKFLLSLASRPAVVSIYFLPGTVFLP